MRSGVSGGSKRKEPHRCLPSPDRGRASRLEREIMVVTIWKVIPSLCDQGSVLRGGRSVDLGILYLSWLCGGALFDITPHCGCKCFEDNQDKSAEFAKQNLYRYLHYYNRYKAHKDSLKQANKLKENIQIKVSLSESKESRIKDYSWVLKGLHRLLRSRHFLLYTYPFAFYMFGDELFRDEITPKERLMKKNLFEDQQEQLESYVEKLSMFLEKDFQHFTNKEFVETRKHIDNLSNVVDTLCKGMYQCIENDLLYPLHSATHFIAPYKSMGLERASEISVCRDTDSVPMWCGTGSGC